MKKSFVFGGTVVFLASILLGSAFTYLSKPSEATVPSVTATASTPLPIVDETPLNRLQKEEIKRYQQQLRESYRTVQATVIGSYTTDLGNHNEPNRVHNIRLSLATIHKTVLLPGETFSFNGAVGDSTNGKLGYKPATVIIGKEFATDYGGGICQVSSTLYNAVAKAKLRVTERYSHSLAVDYVPKGQDATVSYPDLDFKFVNNSEYPIRIESTLQGSKVICTILQVKIGEH
ncbi:VanW family protein [Effusibacillus consociatus]|uniref:VanW family protein n=1 Tax=Effusibacillus consociatus TaxID=1117041 RepID=A0ABV9Q2E7_9BACL